MVECGGLENRFTGNPGDEGSNPSSSASLLSTMQSSACSATSQASWDSNPAKAEQSCGLFWAERSEVLRIRRRRRRVESLLLRHLNFYNANPSAPYAPTMLYWPWVCTTSRGTSKSWLMVVLVRSSSLGPSAKIRPSLISSSRSISGTMSSG